MTRGVSLREGKTIVAIQMSIHSTEVAAAQMSMELAYRFATEDTPRMRTVLDNCIILLTPSHNPDGTQMVAEWNQKTVGTKFEGSPAAVPVPQVRGPRRQPRLVHVHAEGEPAHGREDLEPLASGDQLRHAPDGRQRRAAVHPALRRSVGSRTSTRSSSPRCRCSDRRWPPSSQARARTASSSTRCTTDGRRRAATRTTTAASGS